MTVNRCPVKKEDNKCLYKRKYTFGKERNKNDFLTLLITKQLIISYKMFITGFWSLPMEKRFT